MLDFILNKKNDNYEFEQYKIAVDAAEKTTDRRNQSNTLYMAVVSLILTAIAYSYTCTLTNCKTEIIIFQIIFCVLGLLITIFWYSHMEYWKKLIKLKYTAVTQLETCLKLIPLYEKTNIARNAIKTPINFVNNSRIEKWIPILFNIAFLLYGLYLLNVKVNTLEGVLTLTFILVDWILLLACQAKITNKENEDQENTTLKNILNFDENI